MSHYFSMRKFDQIWIFVIQWAVVELSLGVICNLKKDPKASQKCQLPTVLQKTNLAKISHWNVMTHISDP